MERNCRKSCSITFDSDQIFSVMFDQFEKSSIDVEHNEELDNFSINFWIKISPQVDISIHMIFLREL